MEEYRGRAIVQKIAVGRIWFYTKEEQSVKRYKVENSQKEWERYEAARHQAAAELKQLYQKAVWELGEAQASIFEVHAMMLEDGDYNDSVKNIIMTQGVNAEYAAAATGDNFARMFSEMESEYFQSRADDIRDITERVIAALTGRKKKEEMGDEPVIVAARDLAPSETVQMDKTKVLGFVTELGSYNSHTAILARTMNLPALVGVPIREEWDGKLAVIDGFHGVLYVDPDAETLRRMQSLQREDQNRARLLQELKGKETITRKGQKISLFANVGSISDVARAMENGAEGIGLFRSEFLFLEKDHCPTEEEQFQTYRLAAEMMAGKRVIIRTLDIGADKKVNYAKTEGLDQETSVLLEQEENPALGFRAIRILLERPKLFKAQLRAIYRASAFGEVAVLYPLITSLEEIQRIKEIVKEVQEELKGYGIPFGKVEQGIMIETPAAAVISDLLASEADFFSIGTNDLCQYTLAVDRQNAKLEKYFNPHHPAVLRLIQRVVENGHRKGIKVGICGDLGADADFTRIFVDLGVDELSVAPSCILPLREAIRNM